VRNSSGRVVALTVCALVTGWATAARALEPSSFPQHPVPVVLDGGTLNGPCALASAQDGDTCAFWFASGDGSSQFGYANLDLWNVASDAVCSNAGSGSRSGWIANGYQDLRTVNTTAAGSWPTYVCYDTGHTTSDWMDLSNEIGKVKIFPVNDCAGQVDAGGVPAPCPAIPDKFDVTGFVPLLIHAVYKGNDPIAIGTVGGSPGACGIHTSDPNAICLVLEVVDPIPDAAIGVAKDGPFRGNDVYGTDGAGQTRRRTIEGGTTDSFFIPLQDDVMPDETLVVSGGGSGRNLGIRYFLAGTEVTSSVTGGGLVLTTVPAGAALTLRMSVTVRSGARAGRERTIKVRAVSDFDAGAIDVVGAGVTTA
jgi:hypothetical protein